MKINLGCGFKKREGFLNIDTSDHCTPDLIMNLTDVPWPFESSSVSHVLMESVIEHLPAHPNEFFGVLRELYRVCESGALVEVECPHPNHRWQVVDFTHTKAIHPEGLELLSARVCRKLAERGSTKTPLALIYGIDFELTDYRLSIDKDARLAITSVLGEFDENKLRNYIMLFNNVASTQRFTLRCIK